MTDEKQLLSDELLQQIEDCAREQNRKPSEVLEEAVRRYMALCRLERLAERGEERARARGIREGDVPGLVYRRGKPFQLLRKALEGEINLTVSQAIIDETIEVLSRKFGATAEDLAEARAIIGEAARVVRPT